MSDGIGKPPKTGAGGQPGVSVLLKAQPAEPKALARDIHTVLDEEPFRLYEDGDTYYGRTPKDLEKSGVWRDDKDLLIVNPFDDLITGRMTYPRLNRLFDVLCGSADPEQLRVAEFQAGDLLDSAYVFAAKGCRVDVYEGAESPIAELQSSWEKLVSPIRERIAINPAHDPSQAAPRYDLALSVAPWPCQPIHVTELVRDGVLRGGFAVVYSEQPLHYSPSEWLPIYNLRPDGMIAASVRFDPFNALAVLRRI